MSVLIKGMEMPTSCDKCPFLDYEEGFCFASGVKQKSGWYESTLCPGSIKDGRHDDCPLVHIPPHGRLIDADALRQAMYHQAFETESPMQKWDGGCWIRYKMFEQMEEAAPTIIPADKDGDNRRHEDLCLRPAKEHGLR